MGSLFDYLNWRGDLSFAHSEVNEVDGMIFSLLSYMDLRGIISASHETSTAIPLRSAINAFFTKNPDPKKISLGLIIPKDIPKLIRAVKETTRFRNVGIKAHVNVLDRQSEMQFSATTFVLDNGNELIAFRGTDDSIIGWKENFNMSFMEVVPAQKAALEYLKAEAEYCSGKLMLAGHSKGGNLAVYSATRAGDSIQDRLLHVWSFDGPGFCYKMVDDPSYIRIRPIIRTLIPQSSIVGILMEHEEFYTVVKSRQRSGMLQHDGLTWEVSGASFVHLRHVTDECKRVDRNINQLIHSMSLEQREQFAAAIYQLFSVDNAVTLTDLLSMRRRLVENSKRMDPKVYRTILETLSAMINLSAKNFLGDLRRKK